MKLEVGKYYRTRDGEKVGPLMKNQEAEDPWPFKTKVDGIWHRGYRKDGICCDQFAEKHSQDDLIAEWTDETPTPNKYARTIRSETVDVYDVLHAFNVTDHATAHAVKKLLMAGQRGHKDKITDLREAIASVERQIQMEEGK